MSDQLNRVFLDYIETTKEMMVKIADSTDSLNKNLERITIQFQTHETSDCEMRDAAKTFMSETRTDHKFMNKFLLYLLVTLIVTLGAVVGVKIAIPQALSFFS